jgi:hypothetical protein
MNLLENKIISEDTAVTMFAKSIRQSKEIEDLNISGKCALKSEAESVLRFRPDEDGKRLWLGFFKGNE